MRQSFHFCKMHGLGNDFILINNIHQTYDITPKLICTLANRHLGIGFDQMLVIEKSNQSDFFCRIWNADGSEALQCGNGIRCVARYIHEEKLSDKKNLTIETKSGIIESVIYDYDSIQVNMGAPRFEPQSIPFLTDNIKNLYDIPMSTGESYPFTVLSMGNPHAIIKIENIKNFPIAQIATELTRNGAFPEGVNVGFLEIANRQHIYLRTIERGVGETFACGTNACAAVVAGIMNEWLESKVVVELTYGKLVIEWKGHTHPVMMVGPATRVFSGEFLLPLLK